MSDHDDFDDEEERLFAEFEAMAAPSATEAPLDWWVRLVELCDEGQLEQLKAGELYNRRWGRLVPPRGLFFDADAAEDLLEADDGGPGAG